MKSFSKGKEILSSMKIVNDSIDNEIQVIEEFSTLFLKNEHQ